MRIPEPPWEKFGKDLGMDFIPLGHRHSNKDKGTKQSSVWGRSPSSSGESCGRREDQNVRTPEPWEGRKAWGRASFRSCGVHEDPSTSSKPGSLFWGLSEKGQRGQLTRTLPGGPDR